MKIQEMHYNFKLEANYVDSFDRIDFEPYEIDQYLNKAIWLLLKDRYRFDVKIKKGFETDQSRIDELKTLHVKSPELQPPITPIDLSNGLYEIRLNQLGNNINGQYFRYLFYTKGRIKAEKDGCFKYINIHIFPSDDNHTVFTDASWKWRRVNGNFGRSTYTHPHLDINSNNDSVDTTANLITNNQFHNDELSSLFLNVNDVNNIPQFKIVNVEISYVKYPNRVFFGGYNHIDGLSNASSPPIHCDLDEGFHDEIIRKAVQLAREDLLDQLGIQVSNLKTLADKV